MTGKHSQGRGTGESSVSRRTFVKAAGASGAAVSLAGCIYGDDGGDGGGGNTIVWGFDPTAVQDYGEEIKQLFYDNGLEDYEIEFRAGANETGERRDNYIQLLDTGETEPDLLQMDNGWVNIFIQRGLIANLEEEFEDEDLQTVEEEYFESFTATTRDPENGDLYGVPMYPDFPVMQYRKDYAREAGYDDSDFEQWATEPMTWEEWSQLTAEITEASDAEIGFATQWANYVGTACCTFNEVMSSWGGAYFGGADNLFGPVGDRPITVGEPEVVDSLRMMRTFVDGDDENALDGYAGGIAPNDITSWTEDESLSPMQEGRAVMHRNWPYSLNAVAGELGVDNYGAMPIPYAVSEDEAAQPGTGGTTSALGGWHNVLNPNSENTEGALEVLRVSMQDEVLLSILELVGYLPPKPELFESQEAEDIDPMGAYMNTLRISGENAMPRPVTTVWTSQEGSIAEQANLAVAGSTSPEDAAAEMQSALEETEESEN